MIGIVIFLVGSALSGLSQNMGMLILFRGIQGIGAGALFPVALAIIGDLFTPSERGKYQGLFGAVFGIAFVVGPLVGGFLTEQLRLALDLLRQHPDRPRGAVRHPAAPADREDRPGDAATSTSSAARSSPWRSVFLLVGLTNKQFGETGPIRPSAGSSSSASSARVLFILAESRAKEPIVPLDLFRNRTYSASMVSTFFAAFAFFGAIIFLPRWFQFVQGFSPTDSGLAALPLMVGLIVSSIVSGPDRRRERAATSGCVVGAIVVMGRRDRC